MSATRFSLKRRAMLRGAMGAGVACVGLPLLEAMLNNNGTALAGGGALPKQFVLFFVGNGFRLDQFEPTTTGASFALTPELQPFSGVGEYLKVCTGLQNWCASQPTHHEGMTAYNGYTMAELSGLFSKSGGPTIDQVIADYIEGSVAEPPIVRSIETLIARSLSVQDQGTTMHVLSHRGTNDPLPPDGNLQSVWGKLFSEFEDKPDDSALRLSVVASIREDAKKLQSRVGTLDRQRLEAHLDGINELEQKIKAIKPECVPPTTPSLENPASAFAPLTEVNELMSDMIVHALQCDITRVATVLFIGGAAQTAYVEIGQNDAHHDNTHNDNRQGQVHDGVVYSMERAAYLANAMKSKVDPLGDNLLDTGVMMVGSDCSEGISHHVSRQPYILLGNLRGALVPRWHYQSTPLQDIGGGYASSGNTSDVLMTVLKAFNPAATSVGDMTPRNLDFGSPVGWWGTNNPPNQAVAGSNQIIEALKGPNFGT